MSFNSNVYIVPDYGETAGVVQLTAGNNITLTPSTGVGVVQIDANTSSFMFLSTNQRDINDVVLSNTLKTVISQSFVPNRNNLVITPSIFFQASNNSNTTIQTYIYVNGLPIIVDPFIINTTGNNHIDTLTFTYYFVVIPSSNYLVEIKCNQIGIPNATKIDATLSIINTD